MYLLIFFIAVILARVKREYLLNDTKIYKVRIRKTYKMSEKSEVALKSGRLLTARYDSMCGVDLKVGGVYAISGKVLSLQARINLCGLHELWRNLSRRQRKGLKKIYHHGCHCKINHCWPEYCRYRKKSVNTCNWSTFNTDSQLDCQRTWVRNIFVETI